MAGCCEYGSELLDSVEDKKFPDQLSDSQHLEDYWVAVDRFQFELGETRESCSPRFGLGAGGNVNVNVTQGGGSVGAYSTIVTPCVAEILIAGF